MIEIKPDYCLRKEDFVPLIGIKKHMDRNTYESLRQGENSNYFLQTFAREILLGIYNSAIVVGSLVGLEAIIRSISK
jgi:hypothetical protein